MESCVCWTVCPPPPHPKLNFKLLEVCKQLGPAGDTPQPIHVFSLH